MPLGISGGSPDLGVYSRYKGYNDFQQEAEEQGLKRALIGAQMQSAQTKANDFNLENAAQQALVKTNMGIALSPQEQSVLKSYDQLSQAKLTYTQLPSGEYVPRPAANSILSPQTNNDKLSDPGFMEFLRRKGL